MKLILSTVFVFIIIAQSFASLSIDLDSLPYNTIKFEKSPYGLIFTKIWIDDEEINAMIDFGDPNILQLSTSAVDKLKLSIKASGHKAFFITGEAFDIHEGEVEEVKIGNLIEKNVSFSSSPNEMESVSKQIGTEFNAVVGWGYFKQYHTILNYDQNTFELHKDYLEPQKIFARTYFDKSSTYLTVPIKVNDHEVNAIIDTGSSVTIVDKKFLEDKKIQNASLKIGNLPFYIKTESEDLSMLGDMNVHAIIGSDILQMYKIYINPFESEIFFY